jgi:hypothetical protein
MNTETLTVHPKGDGFEIIVKHDQTGSAYSITLSKSTYEQLRQHFVVGRSEQLKAFLTWLEKEGGSPFIDKDALIDDWLKSL